MSEDLGLMRETRVYHQASQRRYHPGRRGGSDRPGFIGRLSERLSPAFFSFYIVSLLRLGHLEEPRGPKYRESTDDLPFWQLAWVA
ncbi:hypothetical protein BDW60DRAFT_11656 [Aspergillus nidulans var. acristatus]|jgi:hypothetical protein